MITSSIDKLIAQLVRCLLVFTLLIVCVQARPSDLNQPEAMSPLIWQRALHAYKVASTRHQVKSGILTVIDYSKPANEKRLWVIDLVHNRTLFHTYVAHGRGNDALHATHFSNQVGTHQSSLGVYVTKNAYEGVHGYAMRLEGLEPTFNDHAYARSIVMHSQWYVKDPYPKWGFQIGRSWGCPVISANLVHPIIDTIKEGSFILMYYPDSTWLRHSKYLA